MPMRLRGRPRRGAIARPRPGGRLRGGRARRLHVVPQHRAAPAFRRAQGAPPPAISLY